MTQLAPTVLIGGEYELIKEIGRGGMGTVWRASSRRLGRECALKMLLPGLNESDDRQRARLIREARIVAMLSSPYVVTVYDSGEWEGMPYIAMELLEGVTLRQLLRQTPVPPVEVTLELMRQVALGLDKAHDAELVHRDLKPDNIFLLDHKPLLSKILDFGIAKTSAPFETQTFETTTGSIRGTPLYMSPEQARGSKHVDARSDLWSLAVIAFECTVGKPPFGGETLFQLMLQIVSEPLPVPSLLRPGVPAAFDAWWLRAANRDPERRPQSALALVEGLRAALEDNSPAPVMPLAQPRQASVRPRRAVLVAASLLGAAGAGLWLNDAAQSAATDREKVTKELVISQALPQPAAAAPTPPPPAAPTTTPEDADPPPTAAASVPPSAPPASESTARRKRRAPPEKLSKLQPSPTPAEDEGDPLGF